MKKILLLIVVLILASCSDQFSVDSVVDAPIEQTANSDVKMLIEKARRGDGKAYVELANRYRDGIGVNQDFIGMLAMVSFADEYGGICRMEDYLSSLPDDSDYKLVFDAMEKFSGNKSDEALAMAEKLIVKDCPEGYTVKGIITSEQGDKAEGKRLLTIAAEKGSGFAELYLCIPNKQQGEEPDIATLSALVDKLPIANACLAKIYANKDYESIYDERQAAFYYMKADANACLSRDGARWLMGYYLRNNMQIEKHEMERLKTLGGITDSSEEQESVSIHHADPELEELIQTFLDNGIEYNDASKAFAYVVETRTGRIKAHVERERKGNEISACMDTFENEQTSLCGAATYLALLSTGMVGPEYVVETGHGIYKDVKDHNWRRGGYGDISMEFALTHRSRVGFAKALEKVYGDNMGEYNEKINLYHNGQSNSLMGCLTFYNAVANGGCMVKLVTEGNDIEVIHEQIADKKHIAALQKGLRSCVTEGIFKKAGSELTDIAACGRTYNISDMTRRLELCGYFPAENPQYTVLVVLEKDGLPASAGGMCGPIMAEIADALLQ